VRRTGKVLHRAGVINLRREYIHDIGLIVGGATPQPIHFDIAETAENRKDYARIMDLPNGPAVVVCCFGAQTRLGVRKEDVEVTLWDVDKGECQMRKSPEGVWEDSLKIAGQVDNTCYMNDGKEKEESMYVLESMTGFKFRGDFSHSGIPVPAAAAEDQIVWNQVLEVLGPLEIKDKVDQTEEEYRDVMERLCSIERLDMICRFHCMVLPKDEDFTISELYVGYHKK